MTTETVEENRTYQKLLDFAQGTEYGFLLLIVRCWRYDLQRKWREQLERDLQEQGITHITIEGKDLPTDIGIESISHSVQKNLPASTPWTVSLANLEELARPIQIYDSVSYDGISVATRPTPFVTRLNLERDDLVQVLQCPVIFWISPATASQFAESAPDFYDFRQMVLTLPEESRGYEVLQHTPPSLMATPHPSQALPAETLQKLREEVEQLRFLGERRHAGQSRRFISMLTHLATGGGREAAIGLDELQEALAEAQRLNIQEEQARLHFKLGTYYTELAQWQLAKTHYEHALNGYRKLATHYPETYQPDVVQSLNRLANLQVKLGENVAAEPLYQEALDISRALVKHQAVPYKPLLAQTLNNLARLLASQGDLKNAKSLYQEALQCYRLFVAQQAQVSRPQLAHTLNNFANLLADDKNWEGAMPLYEEALYIRRKLWEEAPTLYQTDLAMSLQNQALLLAELRDNEAAQMLYEEVLKLRKQLVEQHPAVSRPELAMTLFNYGLFWEQQGDCEKAIQQYQAAQEQLNPYRNQEILSFETLWYSIEEGLSRCEYNGNNYRD
jgi:tetratricopeptide (TPR) repeat protein